MSLTRKRATPVLAFIALLLLGICLLAVIRLSFAVVQPTELLSPPDPIAENNQQRPLQMLFRLELEAAQLGWSPTLAWRAGSIWYAVGNPAKAAAYWELAGDAPSVRRALAEAYIDLGDWAHANDALVALSQSESDTSATAWAFLQLALIRAATNPDQARTDLDQAVQSEPGYADSTRELRDTLAVSSNPTRIGMALAHMGLWSLAERAFLNAPGDPVALAFTGLSREQQGKEGSAYIGTAVALAPTDTQVRLIQGLFERQDGDYQASLEAFIQAVALKPTDPMLYGELGTAYQLTGDLVSAEHWLQYAYDLSNGDPRYSTMIDQVRTQEQDLGSALNAMIEAALTPTPQESGGQSEASATISP